MPRLILSLALSLVPLGMNALSAQTCDPDGDPDGTVKFVCGTTNPEDLYQVPSTPWVIASGRYSDSEGPIYAVNTRDHSTREIFPAGALPPQHDGDTYRACPGPNYVFQPHSVLRQLLGSVGRRHTRSRDHEHQPTTAYPGGPPFGGRCCDRTLHSDRRRDDPLRVHR